MKKMISKTLVWALLAVSMVLLPGAVSRHVAEAAEENAETKVLLRTTLSTAIREVPMDNRAGYSVIAEQNPAAMLQACSQKFETKHDGLRK